MEKDEVAGRPSAGPRDEPRLTRSNGEALPLEDTIDCKIELRRLFLAESLRLSLGRPEVPGGCPGACPPGPGRA